MSKESKPTKRSPRETALRTRNIAISGVLAALYVVLTLPFAQIAFGPIQARLAEILTILPIFTPYAIPGITIGCFLANLFNPSNLGPIDIIFGTLATLIAGLLTRKIGNSQSMVGIVLGILPPVIVNALIVGAYLVFLLPADVTGGITLAAIFTSVASVGLSEALMLTILGIPFALMVKRMKLFERR